MSSKTIEIILRAKNSMATGLSAAGKQLEAFGHSAAKIGKWFATGFLAAGTAIVGFAAKALQAYAVQEKAEMSLVAALNAHGEAGKALLPTLREIADRIQDETGVADESTLAGMARMRMLGVQTSRLEEAAKATIGLKAAGLEDAAAQKAVAMAMNGNYELLRRYIPAIREANTEQEKAAAFAEFTARGYEQQAATLNTVGGQWAALKGRVGDVWQELGRAIAQNDMVTSAMKRAGDAVKAFGERVKEWAGAGGFQNVMGTARHFGAEMSHRFAMIGNAAHVAWASIGDGFASLGTYLKNLGSAIGGVVIEKFRNMGDYASAVWDKIRDPRKPFVPPDSTAYEAALQDLVDAAAGKDAAITRRTEEALAERDAMEKAHAERVKEIGEQQMAALAEQQDMRVEDTVATLEEIVQAEETAAEDIAAIAKKHHAERMTELQAELAAAQKKGQVAQKEGARQVGDMLREKEQVKTAQDIEKAEKARAERLGRRLVDDPRRMQVKLAKGDQEFLDAFNERERQRKGAADAADEARWIQENIEGMKGLDDENAKLGEIRDTLKEIKTSQDTLLTMA